MADEIIITNNIAVKMGLDKLCAVLYNEESLSELFERVRDLVHKGYVLLSHPLSGSVKPNENPFKSVIMSSRPQKQVDAQSLNIIEQSIITARKFAKKDIFLSEEKIKDFQTVDLALIRGALNL